MKQYFVILVIIMIGLASTIQNNKTKVRRFTSPFQSHLLKLIEEYAIVKSSKGVKEQKMGKKNRQNLLNNENKECVKVQTPSYHFFFLPF